MKPILFALCILLLHTSYAKDRDSTYTSHYTAIKWNIGGLMHLYAPPIILGVEKRWSKKYSTSLQVGMPIPIKYTYDDTIRGRNRGIVLKGHFKNFRRKPNEKGIESFWGVEAFFTNHTYAVGDWYADTLTKADRYTDTLRYSQLMFGMAVITGAQKRFWKHLMVQLYFGVGFKIKNVNEYGTIKPGYRSSNRHDIEGSITNKTGAYTTVALPFHFSIAYYFNPKK